MEENVLDAEVEAAEDAEDTFEVTDVAEDDGDDEFEYDENGDIIIPEVEFEEEVEEEDTETEEETPDEEEKTDSEEEIDDEEAEEEGDGEDNEAPDEENKEAEKPVEEAVAVPDPRDAQIAELTKKLQKLEAQGKDTLKKLGKENADVLEGLIEVAAEVEGKPVAEYKDKIAKEEADKMARDLMRNQMFEAKAASDLKELHAAYPETQKYKHVRELPDGIRQKFGRYRDLGLSAKEAYAAANPDGLRTDTATAVKKQVQHASKDHLKSSVPKPSKSDGVSMSKAELSYWKELFPDKSTAELKQLYKKSL